MIQKVNVLHQQSEYTIDLERDVGDVAFSGTVRVNISGKKFHLNIQSSDKRSNSFFNFCEEAGKFGLYMVEYL